jgi:transcriptional regulator NrdR family protein
MSWKLCPKCRKSATTVIDSRWREGVVQRRHRCASPTCGHRFNTVELKLEFGESATDYINPMKGARDQVMRDLVRYLMDRGEIEMDVSP